MYKVQTQEKCTNNKSPFTFNIDKAIKKSVAPKRNRDGTIIIDKKDLEGREWYYYG